MRIETWPWFNATAAYAALLVGLLLLYWESARPGAVLPGAAGAVFTLVSLARFASLPVTAAGMAWTAAAIAIWLLELWLRWPGVPGLAGALLLTLAASKLVENQPVRWWIAFPLALLAGSATVVLGSAALRGYLLKRTQ
jgi:membrane-bound ClpP family serine protease